MNDFESATEENVALLWERERFAKLWQIEMGCECEEPMQHLKIRMERSENGIDYDLEFGEK